MYWVLMPLQQRASLKIIHRKIHYNIKDQIRRWTKMAFKKKTDGLYWTILFVFFFEKREKIMWTKNSTRMEMLLLANKVTAKSSQ